MESFRAPLDHEQRCAEIVEMCRNGWARPWKQPECHRETETKSCIECDRRFEGPPQRQMCSDACKTKRDTRQARERMRRIRAQRAEERRG